MPKTMFRLYLETKGEIVAYHSFTSLHYLALFWLSFRKSFYVVASFD